MPSFRERREAVKGERNYVRQRLRGEDEELIMVCLTNNTGLVVVVSVEECSCAGVQVLWKW